MTTHFIARKSVLAAAFALLAAVALTSCSYPSDRANQIVPGGSNLHADVRVLSSLIVAPKDGTGTYVATLALDPSVAANTLDDADFPKLSGVTVADGSESSANLKSGSFSPIQIGSEGYVNLADPSVGGVPVTGSFKAGDVLKLELAFSDGSKVDVTTPVVAQCHQYAEIASVGGTAPAPSGSGAYSCDYASPVPLSGDNE